MRGADGTSRGREDGEAGGWGEGVLIPCTGSPPSWEGRGWRGVQKQAGRKKRWRGNGWVGGDHGPLLRQLPI